LARLFPFCRAVSLAWGQKAYGYDDSNGNSDGGSGDSDSSEMTATVTVGVVTRLTAKKTTVN
jgi:hypothetical protein